MTSTSPPLSEAPTRTRWMVIGLVYCTYVLMFIGEAVVPPNGNRVVANWAAPQERGLTVGITVSGSSLGGALTPPFIVWAMVTGTVGGFMNMGGNLGGTLSPTLTPLLAQYYGWDSALYMAAGLAVLAALFWLWVHPERPIELTAQALPGLQAEITMPASE